MQQTLIQIKPVAFHIWEANYVAFQLTSLIPNQYADFHYEIWANDGGLLKQGTLRMEGEDYQNWNADDPFLAQWILAKLQFEGAPVSEPVVPETPVAPVEETPVIPETPVTEPTEAPAP